jgi:hypothetical protein
MEATMEKDNNVNETSTLTGVYIPFKTFLTAVRTFSQAIPPKLDKSAWPTFSNLLKGQTFNAFKFLGLIDSEGNPQPTLRELAKEPEGSTRFKTTLAQIIREKYGPVVELASQHGTINQLQETMKGYNVSGTTLERAIRFWLEAAKVVGISYPESWKRATGGIVKRHKAGAGVQDTGEGVKNALSKGNPPSGGSDQSGYSETVTLPGDIGTITLTVSINPIKLKGQSRDWFNQLIDKLGECPIE